MQSLPEQITVQDRLIETFHIHDTNSIFVGWLDDYGYAKTDSYLRGNIRNHGGGVLGWIWGTDICHICFTAKILEPGLLSVTAELWMGQEDGKPGFFTTAEAISYFKELADAIRQEFQPVESALKALPIGYDKLSDRELEVANLLADGKTQKQIAGTLMLSPHTIKTHAANIAKALEIEGEGRYAIVLKEMGYGTGDKK